MTKARVYREEAVIAKAAELFARDGYEQITMQSLAEQIGIAKPTLYVHAKSKQNLLEAVNFRFLEKAEQCLETARDELGAAAQLRRLLQLWTELYVQERSSIRVYHAENNQMSEAARETTRTRAIEIVETLTEIVTTAQNDGDIKRDVPAGIVVYTLLGAVNWLPRWYRSARWTAQEIGEYLATLLLTKPSAP